MFKAKEWQMFKDICNREGSFQWDIPGGYVIFGTIGMTVFKYKVGGRWASKHINYWREKNVSTVNRELREQKWKEE